jgi:hypothetical protein
MRVFLKWLLIFGLLVTPLATWAFFKPVRVLAPTLAGVQCPTDGICLDDLARLEEATELKDEAVAFVQGKFGPMNKVPRIVFCSTQPCAKAFGFTSEGAYNVGTSGAVISPRGWKPYFVRHELIHHIQNEHLGILHAWLLTPAWFREGMAYSLSEDPRHPLPKNLEDYRVQFESWYGGIQPAALWSAAEAL